MKLRKEIKRMILNEYIINRILDLISGKISKTFDKKTKTILLSKIQQEVNSNWFSKYQNNKFFDEVSLYIIESKVIDEIFNLLTSKKVFEKPTIAELVNDCSEDFKRNNPNKPNQLDLLNEILKSIADLIIRTILDNSKLSSEYILEINKEIIYHYKSEVTAGDINNNRYDLDQLWKEFCVKVSDENLTQIIGSNKSINLQTFTHRENYSKEMNEFLCDEKRCFSVVGPSGYGKTNLMYDYYQQVKDNYNSIFISLNLLSDSLIDYLENLVNKRIVTKETNLEYFLSNRTEKPTILFLDGIDEFHDVESLKHNLLNLLGRKPNLNIKIVLSCRVEAELVETFSIWKKFLYMNGHANLLKDELIINENESSVILGTLLTNEFDQFWIAYSSAFNVSIERLVEKDKIGGLDIPYFMAMACEVFQNGIIKTDITMKELYKKWFDMKYLMMDKPMEARHVLTEISKLCFESDDNVLISYILKDRYLSEKYSIIEEFARLGILKSSKDNNGDEAWRFVNYEMMMYVMFFEDLELDRKDFATVVDELNRLIDIDRIKTIRGVIFYSELMYSNYFSPKGNTDTPSSKMPDVRGEYLCGICKEIIEANELVSYVYMFYMDDFEKQGCFHLCHHDCSNKGVSMLAFEMPDAPIIRTQNINDFLALGGIMRILPTAAKRQELKLDNLYKEINLEKLAIIVFEEDNKENLQIGYESNRPFVFVYKNISLANKYKRAIEKESVKQLGYMKRAKVKRLGKEVYYSIVNETGGEICIVKEFGRSVRKQFFNIQI